MDFDLHKEPWKQRKVLELLLLDRMLRELTQRYDEIIGEIGQQLERLFVHTAETDSRNTKDEKVKGNIVSISNELFSRQMNNGAYLVFRKTWPALQYSLQVIEEDLKEVLEKIDIWGTRKADRRPEEPRWTKNDEGRYRAAITKLTNENLHTIRDLRYHLATIQSLRVSLSSGLDSTRDELSFQNAENIRYFTFLTAVFLPLGFATGIWSMADSSPRSESIKGMVVTAVVTLFLTFTVLINVQRLNEYLSLYTSRTFWEKRNGAQTDVHQEQQNDPSERDNPTHTFAKIRGIQLPGLRKRTEARKSNESLA
jgi:Mg2+ and Co2+ transporter CorA